MCITYTSPTGAPFLSNATGMYVPSFEMRFLVQAASPTPVFGSASTFGGGTGFGGFKGVDASASSSKAAADSDKVLLRPVRLTLLAPTELAQ